MEGIRRCKMGKPWLEPRLSVCQSVRPPLPELENGAWLQLHLPKTQPPPAPRKGSIKAFIKHLSEDAKRRVPSGGALEPGAGRCRALRRLPGRALPRPPPRPAFGGGYRLLARGRSHAHRQSGARLRSPVSSLPAQTPSAHAAPYAGKSLPLPICRATSLPPWRAAPPGSPSGLRGGAGLP